MMNKHEIRKAIFYSSGCDADDWLEGARRSAYAFEGAKKALKKSSQEMLAVAAVVKRDLDDGKLEKMEPSEIADYAILQVTRARDSLANSSQHYENRQMAAQGEISAYERVVKHFKSLHDREEAKAQGIADAIESGEIILEDDGEPVKQAGNGQITGIRPSVGLAAQRRAEAAAEKSSEDDDTPIEETATEVEKPKKKRKKRKSNKSAETETEVEEKAEVAEPSDGENT